MPEHDVELLVDARATIGEGPLWDADRQVLWWIDIPAGHLFRFDPTRHTNDRFEIGQMVGTVVTRQTNGLVLATENGFAFFDPDSGELTGICDPEADQPGNRFNDGKCDPAGRFWAGTMSKTDRQPVGALYCLDTDGSCRKQLSGVIVSNGIVWTADHATMYYIDSRTRRIDAFDFDVESGSIDGRRTVVEVPEGMGNPDGMSIDSEGQLWVGMWGGWCVARFDPATGELLSRLPIPAAHVTACAFGGEALRDLYVTTARDRVAPEDLADQPAAGGLFRVRVEVPGTRSFAYAG